MDLEYQIAEVLAADECIGSPVWEPCCATSSSAYVGAREPYAADEGDNEEINGRVLWVWGSAWRPLSAKAPL